MKIQIAFYPDVDKKDLDSGRTSEIGWQNGEAIKGFEKMFGVRENERLIGVTITEGSIKAKIELS